MTDTHTPDTNDGIAPLAAALAAFQAEMPTVAKNQTAMIPGKDGKTGYSYKYADLADVTSAAMPLLTAQGLSFSTVPRYTEHGYELVGVLLHASGESMEGALPIHGSSAQQLGSAITYARRYLFGCMTGVVTDDDDDGHAASGKPPAARAPRKKAAAADEPPARTEGGATVKQIQKIGILMSELGIKEKPAALDYVHDVIGRRVESRNELTGPEASKVIEALETRGVPARDGPPSAPPPPPPPIGVAAPEEQPISAPRSRIGSGPLKALNTALTDELGTAAGDRERASLLSAVVGRPVVSAEDLTRAEGFQVGAFLARVATEEASYEMDPESGAFTVHDREPDPA